MHWEAVGAIGQVLSSIAVFITLAYLAVQVGHARRETQRAIAQSRSETLLQLLMTDATDADLRAIVVKASAALGGLSSHPLVVELKQRAGITHEEAVALNMREYAWWNYRAQVIQNVDELKSGDRIAFDTIARLA